MQEMASAPFGPSMGLSKEEYAKQVAELEAAEKKHQEEHAEPMQNSVSNTASDTRLVFHDFDYINPMTMLPEGAGAGEAYGDHTYGSGYSPPQKHKLFGITGMNRSHQAPG